MSQSEKSLSVIHGGAMPVLNVSNEDKLTAIRDTVAKGATNAEFTMLMHLANTYQLDPFLKEIWFIKYGGTPTIMVSRDGLRNYAMRQEDFIGMISQEVRQGDTFKFNPITGEINHEIGDGSGPITKCYCIIKRQGKQDHTEIIDFKEYFDALSAKNGVWKTHPSAMGKKTVEVLAFKKCYTITGLYAPEEMGLQDIDKSPVSIDAEYSYNDTPTPKPITSKDARINALEELNAYAIGLGMTGEQIREIGAAVTEKAPTKWTVEDVANVRTYIATYATPTEEDAADATSTEDIDGLPADEDLPW